VNRAVEFDRRYSEALVDEIVRTEHGSVLLTPTLPRVYYLNHSLVDPGVGASASELIAEIEPIFENASLAHRKISIGDELGLRLAPEFRRLGWKTEELLVMPHTGSGPDVNTSAVEDVDPNELEPLWVEGMRASPEIQDEEEIRQLVAAQHRRRRAVDVRYFAARTDGEIGSYCELFSDGQTGQIESVMTLERFRRRGLARAVVSRALAESQARHELTFLVASADDWPKELYRKLGFKAAGSIWEFLRPPPKPAPPISPRSPDSSERLSQ
jgi:GNAT superfamily N-acetyltransferase